MDYLTLSVYVTFRARQARFVNTTEKEGPLASGYALVIECFPGMIKKKWLTLSGVVLISRFLSLKAWKSAVDIVVVTSVDFLLIVCCLLIIIENRTKHAC